MELKILHSADWHLDSPFASFSEEQRSFLRRQQRQLPERIARVCRREGCDLVLLAGDIFDGAYTWETMKLLRGALEECGVPVFIAPGNHDYYGPGSPWVEELWPENVHIFSGGLSWVDLPERNCRVYGGGFTSMDCPPLLEGFRAEGEGFRVGVLHGDPTRANSPYCPVTAAQVGLSGLNYLALGHVHGAGGFQAEDTFCAWPGCPMGRGWDETGDKGLFLVTLSDTVDIRTETLDTPRFLEYRVDTGEDALAALERVLPPVACGDFLRVTLTGSGAGELPELYRRFSNLPNLELRDRREAPLDLWEDVGADSLRGVFFRMLREAERSADPQTAGRVRLAAEISKKLLEGREVTLP